MVTALPPGLEEKDFKRKDPERQLGVKNLPIQFIPSKLPRARTQEEKYPQAHLPYLVVLPRPSGFSTQAVWNVPSIMFVWWR